MVEQEKRTAQSLQGALTMVHKKKLSVASLQVRAKVVIDSQGEAAEAEKKFIVKVNGDLEEMQKALQLAEHNTSQMLIGSGIPLEEKVAYLQVLAEKMQKLQTLSQPLLTSQDDRIGGIGSMCPWGVGFVIWALQEQCERCTGRNDYTAVHRCIWD